MPSPWRKARCEWDGANRHKGLLANCFEAPGEPSALHPLWVMPLLCSPEVDPTLCSPLQWLWTQLCTWSGTRWSPCLPSHPWAIPGPHWCTGWFAKTLWTARTLSRCPFSLLCLEACKSLLRKLHGEDRKGQADGWLWLWFLAYGLLKKIILKRIEYIWKNRQKKPKGKILEIVWPT